MSYHMRRDDREITDWATIEEILCQGKYAILALCRNDEPYAVTLNYGYDGASRSLFFHCAQEGLKTEIVRENARVCATVIDDRGYVQGECEHRFRSVVIRGTDEILSDFETKKHALNVLVDHLESDPEPVKARTMGKPEQIHSVGAWKIRIEECSAKQVK